MSTHTRTHAEYEKTQNYLMKTQNNFFLEISKYWLKDNIVLSYSTNWFLLINLVSVKMLQIFLQITWRTIYILLLIFFISLLP